MRVYPLKTVGFRVSFLSALAVSLGMACVSAHGAIIQQNNSEALVATETAAGGQTQATATIGPISSYNGGANQDMGGAPVAQPSLFNLVPYSSSLDVTFSSTTDAQNAVASYLSNYLGSISKAMATQMKSSDTGVAMGIFTFVQDVKIASPSGGTPTKSEVFGTLVVYPDGHYEYLGTNVNNNTIYMLYAIYQQKQDAYYLPSGWVLPDAGDTQWELLKASFNGSTMSASAVSVGGSIWHLVNDNGAYDAPVTMNGSKQVVNYNAGVSSWVKNQIVPLMKQYNANLGIIRYGQQVNVQRNSAGQPIMALSINSRTFAGGCGHQKTLSNSGQYGYLLKFNSVVYTVEPNGEYSPLQEVTTNGLALTSDGLIHENGATINENFNVSANLASGTTWSQEQNDIVFPIAPDQGQIIDWESGEPLPTSDYVYVAPLTNNTDNGSYVPGVGDVCVSQTMSGPFSEPSNWCFYPSSYIPYGPGGGIGIAVTQMNVGACAQPQDSYTSGRPIYPFGYNDVYAPEVSINGKMLSMGDFGYNIGEAVKPVYPFFFSDYAVPTFLRCTATTDVPYSNSAPFGYPYDNYYDQGRSFNLGSGASGCSILVGQAGGFEGTYSPYDAYWCPSGGGQCDYMGQTDEPIGTRESNSSTGGVNSFEPSYPGVPDDQYDPYIGGNSSS
ncbi:hypothetical protein [Acidithiobacillus sp.]|uniref:hypothetical protein n=1 Tax=Acidithiobacillus sp. TaxID=1872118 RepID=UPI002602C2DC|nr:hypothetical protein [Acidithiobacillus sp.]MDD5278710.1 hypothetical protein [Acidithiobacillus sp.]